MYRDVQKVQDDQIPIFAGSIAVEVVEPLVEAKKDQAALKGLKLAEADVIHAAVLADLGYIERKLARAAQLLPQPEEAAAQLALAQNVGIRLNAHKEDNPLVEVQHALRLAERMVQEKKYEGAKANLQLAKLRLEAYRGLVGANEAQQRPTSKRRSRKSPANSRSQASRRESAGCGTRPRAGSSVSNRGHSTAIGVRTSDIIVPPGVYLPTVALTDLAQQVQEILPVSDVLEEGFPPVAPRHQVIMPSGQFEPHWRDIIRRERSRVMPRQALSMISDAPTPIFDYTSTTPIPSLFPSATRAQGGFLNRHRKVVRPNV